MKSTDSLVLLVRQEEKRLKKIENIRSNKEEKERQKKVQRWINRKRLWDTAARNVRKLFTESCTFKKGLSHLRDCEKRIVVWILVESFRTTDAAGDASTGYHWWRFYIDSKLNLQLEFEAFLHYPEVWDISATTSEKLAYEEEWGRGIPDEIWEHINQLLRTLSGMQSAVQFFYRTEFPLRIDVER